MALFSPLYMKSSLRGDKLEKALQMIENLKEKDLIKVATNAPTEEVRLVANAIVSTRALTEEDRALANDAFVELLFETDNYQVDPPNIALKHIGEICDQGILFRIAIEIHNSKTKSAAVNAITDENLLTKIVLSCHDYSLRRQAIDHIKDHRNLAEIATSLEAEDMIIRGIVIDRINDPAVLVRVLKLVGKGYYWEQNPGNRNYHPISTNCYYDAIKKINDHHLLEDLALSNIDMIFRKEVIKKIDEPAALTRIIIRTGKNGGAESDIYIEAIEKIKDQHMLEKIAKSNIDYVIRYNAAERLTDKSILEEIIRSGKGHSHTHKWVEIPGSRITVIDRQDFSSETYQVKCSECGKIETREFSRYWDDA